MRRDLLMLAAMFAAGGLRLEVRSPLPQAEWPKCLLCRKPKNHNNSFCSAECCKKYKAGERYNETAEH